MSERANAAATIVAVALICAAAAWAVDARIHNAAYAASVGLLLYIDTFLLAKAIRIRRGGPLGVALATFNVVLAGSFLWSIGVRLWPALRWDGRAFVAVYAALAVAVTYGWWELMKATRWPWRRRGDER